MDKRNHTTIYLPNPTPYVELPNYLAAPLELIIHAGERGINTLELQTAGIIASASTVSRLTARGALIDRELKNIVDSGGRIRKRVAHYIYRGWISTSAPHTVTEHEGNHL